MMMLSHAKLPAHKIIILFIEYVKDSTLYKRSDVVH